MSRHFRLSRVSALVFALSFVPALSGQDPDLNGDKQQQRHLTLEQVSPENTLVFASFAGLDACSKAASDVGLYRFFAEPEMQAFLAPLIARFNELATEVPESVSEQWEMARAVGTGRVSFALTGITFSSESSIPVLPAALVAIDVAGAREQAASLIEMALGQFSSELDARGVAREVKPFKGIDVNVFKVSIQNFEVAACYAFLDNLLLVSVGQGPIRKAINLSQRPNAKTLDKSAMFLRCRSKSRGHTLMEFYAGVQALIKRTKLFIPDEIERAIDEVGLGNVGAIYLASAVNDGDSFDTAYLDAPLPRKGLLTLANGKPLSAATMRMVPADALAFVGFRCDMAKAFDTVWGGFEMAAGEEMLAEAKGALSQIQDEMGLDIREDILGALGEEMVIYGAMPRELRLPKIVVSIAVRDRAKAAKLIDVLMNQMPIRLTRMKHGEHVINMTHPSNGTMVALTASPCFTLLEDRLLISVTRTGLEQALDRISDQSAGGIRGSANFRETMRGMPSEHASMMWWLDIKRVLALAYEAAYDFLPAVAGPQIPVDPARMPKLDTFLSHTHSLGGVAYGDEDGLVMQSRSPGLAAILALASRMMMETPGVPPFAIQRIMGDLDGRQGRSHPGQPEEPGVGRSANNAIPAPNIVNPLDKDDPAFARMMEQVAALRTQVAKTPADGGEHFRLAGLYHQIREFAAAAEHFQRAAALGHNVPTATYNAACALSLEGKKEDAVKALTKAVEVGFDARGFLQQDSDLDNIRDTEGFKKLLRKVKSR